MPKPETVLVTAAPGRIVPIAAHVATAPGGRLLLINPGDEVELPYESSVRRRLAAGDLVIVEPKSLPPPPASSSSSATSDKAKEG